MFNPFQDPELIKSRKQLWKNNLQRLIRSAALGGSPLGRSSNLTEVVADDGLFPNTDILNQTNNSQFAQEITETSENDVVIEAAPTTQKMLTEATMGRPQQVSLKLSVIIWVKNFHRI